MSAVGDITDGPITLPQGLADAEPTCVANRYEIKHLLGRGGMASAYRAYDRVRGQEVALKRLSAKGDPTRLARTVELFEREYHTLVQLTHPRVVRAFDYGVDDGAPYYTMELLDGGDLREAAPLPWREVCRVAYDICSALSLLHSRGLVHRDLTPRNVRCTGDGKAKLIDFGLLAPTGPSRIVAGTPPFVAPELIQNMTLDARSDLFSLGATLYHALTGRTAFPARRFDQLRDIWRSNPVAPSKLVEGIPPAVDQLVLALLRIDAGSRPKSAAEVMDRLLPLLDAPPDGELSAATAYLTTPRLVGRDELVVTFRRQVARAMRRRGGGFFVTGEAGVGRSRVLDAFVLEAKLVGASVIRASAGDAAAGAFGVAKALIAQLSPSPEVGRLLEAETDRTALHEAFRAWLLEVAARRLLAIAIDDLHKVDEPSASLLASLTWEAPRHRLVYAVTAEANARSTAPGALALFHEHGSAIELAPLGAPEMDRLLASVFGEVPNLQLLSRRLHALCGGRPRECMMLAQHLVDERVITYRDGTWTLPEEIGAGVLPASIEETLRRQLLSLTPLSRRVALLLALGVVNRLSRAQLLCLEGVSARELDAATTELIGARVLAGDPSGYTLCHSSLERLLVADASAEEQERRHRELSRLYVELGMHSMAVAYHLLRAKRTREGLELLLSQAGDDEARTRLTFGAAAHLEATRVADTLELAVDECERLGLPAREQQKLWVMLAGMSSRGEDVKYYYRIPSVWLEQLKRESGLDDWHALASESEPATRALKAFAAATERYEATPEAERGQAPLDANKQLVAYVVFSFVVGLRALDLKLLASLPPLLEPFSVLNPLVAAMLGNARATLLNALGQREQAHPIFVSVLEALEGEAGQHLPYARSVCASLRHTLAGIDAALGIHSRFIDELAAEDQDPNQRVGSFYLRKVAALHQGDWEAAERYRRQAELLALQSTEPSMFSTLPQELEAHALAHDLTGLKQVRHGVHEMAARHPGWIPMRRYADAQFDYLCGDLEGALATVADVDAGADPDEPTLVSPWVMHAKVLEVEVRLELGQAQAALQLGEATLDACARLGLRDITRALHCAVALSEAALGRCDAALARVEGVLEEQGRLGVTGLRLGRSYESCARIAIAAGDAEAFERYAALAREQYRAGDHSVLGALYERLMERARIAGIGQAEPPRRVVRPDLTQLSITRVTTVMDGCSDRVERAQRALGLLCDTKQPTRGHLFLLTDTGLTLVASNTQCDSLEGLRGFAQGYLEQETDDSDYTVTAAAVDDEAASGIWVDNGGASYVATLLRAAVDGDFKIVGVAMLAGDVGKERSQVLTLAAALAKNLIESGEYRPVQAA